MELILHEFDLPLKYKFGISRETRLVQKTVIAEVRQQDISGYGEAVANHKYYGYTVEKIFADLHAIEEDLKKQNVLKTPPDALWALYHSALKNNPFAQCALDMALWDLYGKLKGKKTYELWRLDPSKRPVTDYTIGIDDIEIMKKKLLEFKDWPVFKIKLGTHHDMEIIRELRKVTDAVLRIDANCAWTAEQTIEYAKTLKALKVEFIEQPLPADDWEGMKKVYQQSVLPIIADESCVYEEDVNRCQGYFHGVNIKVVKCGGLTPALRMIRRARELGMKVMVGCMTESTVGISGIAQLIPLLDYVDADGPLLLAKDIATGVTIDKGVIYYSDIPGNGVVLKAAP
ncbi:MAG: dipeptide epimerase [Candidatus Marinimicrobia bacterium]|nr:dipeptide epimerase [Candidatus Neomarinimicrobiota bacterium]MDD5583186.1 dipeptide epimerase [Candidatus Neomarinimicrobiota bacterium]